MLHISHLLQTPQHDSQLTKSTTVYLQRSCKGRDRAQSTLNRLPKFFWVPPVISGMRKAVDFKSGKYIQRVHPNKSPRKILEIRERGRIQKLPNFFPVPCIISRTRKATNFKFCMHIYRLDRNKSPLNISGKVAMGVVRNSRKFSGHLYTGSV